MRDRLHMLGQVPIVSAYGGMNYHPVPYRYSYRPPALSQSHGMGQMSTGNKVGVTLSALAVTALSGATIWVGVRSGMKEKGFYSILGWTAGATGVILGLTSLGALGAVFTGLIGNKAS